MHFPCAFTHSHDFCTHKKVATTDQRKSGKIAPPEDVTVDRVRAKLLKKKQEMEGKKQQPTLTPTTTPATDKEPETKKQKTAADEVIVVDEETAMLIAMGLPAGFGTSKK